MNNREARAALNVKQDALTASLRDVEGLMMLINQYENESGDWKTAVATAKMAAIKSGATAAGVDLSTWTGAD